MVGNFELKPQVVTMENMAYVVHGYREYPDGTRIAEATIGSDINSISKVNDMELRELLIKIVDEKTKHIKHIKHRKKRKRKRS